MRAMQMHRPLARGPTQYIHLSARFPPTWAITTRNHHAMQRRRHTHTSAAAGPDKMKINICVLGAGIIGLATGIVLQQQLAGKCQVTIIAEEFGKKTCSFGAGGFWKPVHLGDAPSEDVNRWASITMDHLREVYHSPDAGVAGIQAVEAKQMFKQVVPDPTWSSVVPSFRHLTEAELSPYKGLGYCHGWCFSSIICEPRRYLPWLLDRFEQKGGITVEQRIDDFLALAEKYDVLINCTGLGAAQLCNDLDLIPVRGQVLRVRAPWVKNYLNGNGPTYIIPNTEDIVIGGTTQENDWDTVPREEDTADIVNRASELIPSLKTADIVEVWAGLRPVRSKGVRLESEVLQGKGQALKLVHNYGHGGGGITLHWGCALEAVALVEKLI